MERPPLPVGERVVGSLRPGERHLFPVDVGSGVFLRARVFLRDSEFTVRLLGPDGGPLTPGGGELLWITRIAGVYRVEVATSDLSSRPLEYVVKLEVRPAAADDPLRLEAYRLEEVGFTQMEGSRNDPAAAIQSFEQARAIFHAVRSPGDESQLVLELAEAAYELGDFDLARRRLEEGLALAREAGDREHEARALSDLGRVLSEMGQQQAALEVKERALAIYGEIGARAPATVVRTNLAASQAYLGDYSRALRTIEPAIAYHEQIGAREQLAKFLVLRARWRTAIGDNRGGLADARRTAQLAREVHLPQIEVRALEYGAMAQLALGQQEEAKRTLEQALALAEQSGNRNHQALIRLDLASIALSHAEAARARELAIWALAQQRSVKNRAGQLAALTILARAERVLGEVDPARRHVATALDLGEATRSELVRDDWRITFQARQRAAYELGIELAMDAGDVAGGFALSERYRARGLLDRLTRRSPVSPDPALDARRREIEAALASAGERQLRALSTPGGPDARADIEREVEQLTDALADAEARIRATAGEAPPPRLLGAAELGRELLGDGTTLLEYFLGSERSWLWVVDGASLRAVRLPSAARVESAARAAHAEVSKRRLGKEMERLATMVLAPAGTPGSRLAVVPDGALQLVPFGALPLRGGRPLVATTATVVLPSASALAAVRTRVAGRSPPQRLAAVIADPVFSARDPRVRGDAAPAALSPDLVRTLESMGLRTLPRLPGTLQEAELLVRLGGSQEVFRAIGFDATREVVTGGALDSARLVHFATHALVDGKHPELSGLVLSLVDRTGAPRNGFLQAHEIPGLRLQADLVVLSACRTAVGQEVQGEGLLGVARAFMGAGVPRVLGSLWSVRDSATAELMSRFYGAQLGQGLPAAEALRRAQDTLRRERAWSDPYDWAGFTLQGDWR